LIAATGSPISPAIYVLVLSAGALAAVVLGLPRHAGLAAPKVSYESAGRPPAKAV
jgi:hypothetical protein